MSHTRVLSSPFIRLTIYYVIIGLIGFGLFSAFPIFSDAFGLQRLRALVAAGGGEFSRAAAASAAAEAGLNPVQLALTTTIAILGGLVLLAPTVWVYMVTKQERGYDESVVHTVMILPVAVTGLVIVVQNSLALAFSLAGIVAAVRFRHTLEDAKDAVYIFLAIGIALAAGAQALGIAAVSSIIFNYLVLTMWRFKVGNIYADQLALTPKMRIGDVLAGPGTPGAGSGQLTIGGAGLLAALTPDSLKDIVERRTRLREAAADGAEKGKKYNGLLIVLGDGREACLEAIDSVLGEFTDQYKLAEVSPTMDGNSSLEYLLSLPKDTPAPRLIATLRERAGQYIVAAEYRNFKARKTGELLR